MEKINYEKELLIYCIHDLKSIAAVLDKNIEYSQFSTKTFQLLFRGIIMMYKKFNTLVDEGILKDYVFIRGEIKDVEVQHELTLLLYDLAKQPLPTNRTLDFVIEQFQTNYLKRQLNEALMSIDKTIKSGDINQALNVYKDHVKKFNAVDENIDSIDSVDVGEGMKELGQVYEERAANPDKFRGLHIGYPTFDGVTDGLHPGQLTLLAGAEKSGKSVLLTNIVYNVIQKPNKRVAAIVTEGGTELPIRRLAIRHAGVNATKARDSKLNEEEKKRYFEAIKYYENSDAYVIISIAPSSCTASTIQKELEKHEKSGPFDLVMVDHIGLMNTDDIDARHKEHTRLERVVIELIDVARIKKVPIIAVTHINREAAKREAAKRKGSKFNTFDLARSFNIGQHIDTMISWCPKNPDELEKLHSGEIVMSVPTIRDGETASITLDANFVYMKVVEKSVEIVSYKEPAILSTENV
jgi:replicative DNA helicase